MAEIMSDKEWAEVTHQYKREWSAAWAKASSDARYFLFLGRDKAKVEAWLHAEQLAASRVLDLAQATLHHERRAVDRLKENAAQEVRRMQQECEETRKEADRLKGELGV